MTSQQTRKTGTLYGIGVGPGDPELMTLKGARVLRECRRVFVPKARDEGDSAALSIAGDLLRSDARIQELVFPMVTDRQELARRWQESARELAGVLQSGEDACFLTLGDPLLYSTYIYLLRALRGLLPEAKVVTVPGVTAFSAAAALTDFPVGEAKDPVTIVPAADDLRAVEEALDRGGTVVLMKVGKRLEKILDLLQARDLIDQAVFVARAGQPAQRLETDLRKLREEGPEAGYLSIILVHAGKRKSETRISNLA
ncbi:MAG: precorrin-2 C(20)-methyltransferase [Deltaproteobacteria bacterium]|nr:precorrin-2 C(20)-methyltransferase [Deltaproteobacteria bacterium]